MTVHSVKKTQKLQGQVNKTHQRFLLSQAL